MADSSSTPELLRHWWNFTDAGHWGLVRRATQINELFGEEATTPGLDALGLVSLLSTPLDPPTRQKDGEQPVEKEAGSSPCHETLLDLWLNRDFDSDDFDSFRAELEHPTEIFDLVMESGKRFRGPLAALCSIRIASLLMQRPNPLFFFPPARSFEGRSQVGDVLFDPRTLLPTGTAGQYRNRMMTAGRVVIASAQVFLAQNYLPELTGRTVVHQATLHEAHGSVHSASSVHEGSSGLMPEPRMSSRELAEVPLIRFPLLGLGHLVKKAFSRTVRYGNKQQKLISRLVGPRSSKRILGAKDYAQLQGISRQWLVSK